MVQCLFLRKLHPVRCGVVVFLKHDRPARAVLFRGDRPYEEFKKSRSLQEVPARLAPGLHGHGAEHRKACQARLPLLRRAPRGGGPGGRLQCLRRFCTASGVEQGCLGLPQRLARFGVAQTRDGRKVGGHLNVRDVSSPYCQREKGITVDRLDKFDRREEAWLEVLLEDRHAGPAEVAAIRVDFAAWLPSLPRRLRQIATFLAGGETTTAAARRFQVSPGRISQIRQELCLAWQRFQGDEPACAAA